MKSPNDYRIRSGELASDDSMGCYGAFCVPSVEPGWNLLIIASDADDPVSEGWQHVSVHAEARAKQRTPSWKEMCQVKDLFWEAEDVVIQFHPKRSEYVNVHPLTLHLWRHLTMPIPQPPVVLVG